MSAYNKNLNINRTNPYKNNNTVGGYMAIDVANYIVNYRNNESIPIIQLGLQKLLYYVQCYSYRILDEYMIREDFYAWQHGPTIEEIFNLFSIYGPHEIPRQKVLGTLEEDSEACSIIGKVLRDKKHMNFWELVDTTCAEDPWYESVTVFGNRAKIPKQKIREYARRAI